MYFMWEDTTMWLHSDEEERFYNFYPSLSKNYELKIDYVKTDNNVYC